MVATLNYDLKDAPAELFDKCRWSLLTMFILHANVRNRCWPSMRGLAKRLDMSLPYITQAKQWLIEHEAIKLVSFKERVEDEKTLANHQHVYQLTGYVKFGDVKIQYLYINPDRGNDQPGETSKPGKGKRRETSKPVSMINSVNDQRGSPLTIPIEESTIPIEDKGTGVPLPAPEPAQPIEPEPKREEAEPEPTIVQENSSPSKVSPKVSPAADKPARASQPHILLIEAWHEAHPAEIKPIGKPNIVRNVKTAKELVEAGVTTERLVAFMNDTYPGYIEWARSRGTSALMSLEHIKNNIRAWEAKKPNGNIKNGRYQPDDYWTDPALLNGD